MVNANWNLKTCWNYPWIFEIDWISFTLMNRTALALSWYVDLLWVSFLVAIDRSLILQFDYNVWSNCSDLLVEGTIYSNGFLFSQFWPIDMFILELRLVSLESPSSLECGIKKIFRYSFFYRELSRFKVLWIVKEIPLFLFTFSVFWPNFCQVC